MNKVELVRMFFSVFTLALHAMVFNYVYNLEKEKCVCSAGLNRTLVKYGSATVVVLVFLGLLLGNRFPVLMSIIGFVSLPYIISVVVFVVNLIRKKCRCSDTWERRVLQVWIALLTINFLVAIIMLAMVLRTGIPLKRKV